jgi:hypothetical protein
MYIIQNIALYNITSTDFPLKGATNIYYNCIFYSEFNKFSCSIIIIIIKLSALAK